MDKKKYESLPASAFEFVPEEGRMHDKKLESKPIGYFRDAFNRFCRNKSSVVAAFIIMILFLFAVFVPIFCENSYTRALTDTDYLNYTKLLPKSKLLGWLGVDGTKVEKDVNSSNYLKYQALYEETGYKAVVEIVGEPRVDKTQQAAYEKKIETLEKQIAEQKSPAVKKKLQKNLEEAMLETPSKFYDLRIDTYQVSGKYGMHNLDLTYAQYKRIQNWQNDTGIQVIFPVVDEANADSNIWFVHEGGTPVLDDEGKIQDNYVRKAADKGPWDKSATVKAYGADVTVDVKFNLNGTVSSLNVSLAGESNKTMELYTTEAFTSQFIGKAAPFVLADPTAGEAAEGSVIECAEGTYADGQLADVSSLRTAEAIVKVLNEKAATLEKAPFVRSQDITVADMTGKVNLTFDEDGVITEFQVELTDDGTDVVKYYLSEEFANQFIGKSGRFTTSGQTKTSIGDGKEVVIQPAPIGGAGANKLDITNVFDVIHDVSDFVEVTANTKLCNGIVNAVTNQTPKGFEFKETATAFETFVTVNATFDEKGYVTAFTMEVDGETATMTSEEATAAFADQVIGKRAPFVQVKTKAEKEKVNDLDSSIDAVSGATMTGNAAIKALHNAAPDYTSSRIPADEENEFIYAKVGGSETSKSYNVRINLYNYFQYKYGFEPSFFFGTNTKGQDILTRLASGARFSFILAIGVSSINMLIGAIYGAIQGYYGGTVDLVMDRVSDVLNNVPFMVVTALFQLHLANKVGPVVALIFAFVLTGWIGMAARVRMQFYRFKGQEYILAARTLGAKDSRLMFKHIFPNSLGTIITGSVLVIPGMIFSESSMTYLGIVNLESSTMTSVGTMLANGKDQLQTNPHIILFPALYVSLLMISFNLFGNGLRDAFNPSLRGAE